MEQLLAKKIMEKGEEAAEFQAEDGVNMNGETLKHWKGKRELQKYSK